MIVKGKCSEHPASSIPTESHLGPKHESGRAPLRDDARPCAPGDAPRFLTALEAAAYLGIGRNTVSQLVKRGELPGRRIGGRFYIPREELERIGLEHEDAA